MVEFYVHIKHDVYEQKITHNGKCKSEEMKLIAHHDHSYENRYLKTYVYKSNLGLPWQSGVLDSMFSMFSP